MKRMFCAAGAGDPGALQDMTGTFRDALSGDAIRWVAPENLHVTLAFLGDVPGDLEGDVADALHRASNLTEPFSFTLRGCGSFGSPPRVLWVGIDDNGAFARLHQKVWRALEPLGFVPEKRDFSPHLTFGRIKRMDDPGRLAPLLEKYRSVVFGTVDVDAVILFQSILRQQGPTYRVAARFPLGRPSV